jgi:hypothetical protein
MEDRLLRRWVFYFSGFDNATVFTDAEAEKRDEGLKRAK